MDDAQGARERRRVTGVCAWLGFTLATLFLYPLAAALDSGIYYLQWQRRDLVETLTALASLTLLFAVALYVVWPLRGRRATIALLLVAAIPMMSFGAGVAKQLPLGADLRIAWENHLIRYGAPAAVGLLLVAIFVFLPEWLSRSIRILLAALSPASLVVVANIVASAAHPPPTVQVEPIAPSARAAPATCSSVLALLFDELSFAYLYDGTSVRAEYPAIRSLASTATSYLAVSSPGPDTLSSMPGYLTVRRNLHIAVEPTRIVDITPSGSTAVSATERDGLFAMARSLGYGTEMAGYYFPYCALLGNLVDRCRSFSFYSISPVREGFSPLNPILTTLILWPRQFPLGLLKNVPFADLQRRMVEATRAFAERPLAPSEGVFRFVHFSVPHLPFVFTAAGYEPPFDPLRTSPDADYRRQIAYVDRLVGDIVARMKRDGTFDDMTVVIFADHGFRFGGEERDPRHIPFIVKLPGQGSGEIVVEPHEGERLLLDVLRQSCKPAS